MGDEIHPELGFIAVFGRASGRGHDPGIVQQDVEAGVFFGDLCGKAFDRGEVIEVDDPRVEMALGRGLFKAGDRLLDFLGIAPATMTSYPECQAAAIW